MKFLKGNRDAALESFGPRCVRALIHFVHENPKQDPIEKVDLRNARIQAFGWFQNNYVT